MKKILFSLLTLALTCGFVSAIGIDWSVDALSVSSFAESSILATTGNYGDGVGEFELRLMFIGTATESTVKLGDLTLVDTGSLGLVPGDGYVQGSASVAQAANTSANYLMVLYSAGNYYKLTTDATTLLSALTVPLGANATGTENFEYFKDNAYKGAQIVPEPGTAALAIAGLALLFRRKRA